jgi:hypothetical protein
LSPCSPWHRTDLLLRLEVAGQADVDRRRSLASRFGRVHHWTSGRGPSAIRRPSLGHRAACRMRMLPLAARSSARGCPGSGPPARRDAARPAGATRQGSGRPVDNGLRLASSGPQTGPKGVRAPPQFFPEGREPLGAPAVSSPLPTTRCAPIPARPPPVRLPAARDTKPAEPPAALAQVGVVAGSRAGPDFGGSRHPGRDLRRRPRRDRRPHDRKAMNRRWSGRPDEVLLAGQD